MEGAELMVPSDLFLLAGQLKHDEVLSEHVGSHLRIVLVAAGRTVQELLLLVYHIQTLLTHRMSAI